MKPLRFRNHLARDLIGAVFSAPQFDNLTASIRNVKEATERCKH